MADVTVPWGDETWTMSLPPEWTVQQVAQSETAPAPGDWPDRMGRALAEPVTGPPLSKLLAARRGGRVAIIVEDLTRHSPLETILPIILREIRHAGLADSQVEIVFAGGMHPPMTPREVAGKLGGAADGITWRCNPWKDASAYALVGQVGRLKVAIDRGVLEADLRIIVSSVSVHMQAGFGGGYKMFFPGCASLETIRQLHRTGLDGDHQWVGTHADANPMRKLINAAGQAVDAKNGHTFAVQYVLDAYDQPKAIAAGDVVAAHQMLTKQCAVASGVLVESPADVVISNAYPRDLDLWQSFKAIANTRYALRPDGVMICLSRCEAAMQGMNVPRWPINPTWMRRLIRWLGASTFSSMITRLAPRLAADAAFFIRIATQTLHRNPLLLVSPILHATGGKFPGLELFADVDSALAHADRLLGGGPQRVVVFPTGGTTYPIPRDDSDPGKA